MHQAKHLERSPQQHPAAQTKNQQSLCLEKESLVELGADQRSQAVSGLLEF